MWRYILYWTLTFANVPATKQNHVYIKPFDTRREVDSAINNMKREALLHDFKMTYSIDSVNIQ